MPLLPLQFIIVGASVAGLSSAYMLGKAGHKVIVVEMEDGNYSASVFRIRRGISLLIPLCLPARSRRRIEAASEHGPASDSRVQWYT